MSNLVRRIRGGQRDAVPSGPWSNVPVEALGGLMGQFEFGGLSYGGGLIQTYQQNRETIRSDFEGIIHGAYRANGAIFACVLTRMLLFTEATFQFRRRNNGRPGGLFGTDALRVLEEPWPNGTTGDLLARMEVDISMAGNFYATAVPDRRMKAGWRIARLRPDWTTIIIGSLESDPNLTPDDPDAELVGYMYEPGGPGSGRPPKFYLPEKICHYAPIPDADARYRGMSWIQPVLEEVLGDRLMNTHKRMYFENGATPNLVVSMETGKMNKQTFQEWVDAFENQNAGVLNAYKTLYLGHGANASVVGNNLRDLEYAIVQGHGETRLAAAAGIPPIIVGFSEGLQSATYSNFDQARRSFADKLLRPLWRNASGSLQPLIALTSEMPGGAELWYDDRDIPFLQADAADRADVQLTRATAARLLIDAGFEAESVVNALEQDDFTLLKHSGLFSVQLQAPSTSLPAAVGEGWSPGDEGDGTGDGGEGDTGNGNGGTSTNGNGGPAPPNGSSASRTGIRRETSSFRGLLRPGKRATILENVDNVQQLAQALKAATAGSDQR